MLRKIMGFMVLMALAITLPAIYAYGQLDNRAEKIVVDSAGNVYVTGYSNGRETGYDYTTIKYDSSGHELWVARYNGPANSYDSASDITVDALGNVYVTGSSQDLTTVRPTTIKYNSSGQKLWVARYNSVYEGYGKAVAVDILGNVYVGGSSNDTGAPSPGAWFDYVIIKYDSSGHQLWVARYNGPGNGQDHVTDLVIDASGNVYVTGESVGTSWDFATVKYDPSGNELWVARYDNPSDWGDQLPHLTVDSVGNVYVTGSSSLYGSYDYTTIKYDSSGHELWVVGPTGPGDWAQGIAVDALGNTYVTGWGMISGWGYDYVTIKYDPSGTKLWMAGYTNPACDMGDLVAGLALDSSGNVYVTGTSYNPKGWGYDTDYATVKYDSFGHELWVARYTSPESNVWEIARDLAVDSLGNVYVTGFRDRLWGNSGLSIDEFLTVKYDSFGQLEWVARYANAEVLIGALIQQVQAIDLKNGAGYTAKLDAALASYQEVTSHDYINTINQLEAFKNKCDNDPHLSEADRAALKNTANEIIAYLQSKI